MPYTFCVTVRKTLRREVRLDPDYDQQLEAELARRRLSFAAWLREQIDRDAAERARTERKAMVEQLCNLEIDWGLDEVAGEPGDPASNLVRKVMAEAWESTGRG